MKPDFEWKSAEQLRELRLSEERRFKRCAMMAYFSIPAGFIVGIIWNVVRG